jgi:type I restriction enzyme S subunit
MNIIYLTEYLESLDYAGYNTGTAQPKLNNFTCQNIPIYIPLLTEQKAIAEALSDMDAEITALESRYKKTEALKQGMMQELLTGRTRLV